MNKLEMNKSKTGSLSITTYIPTYFLLKYSNFVSVLGRISSDYRRKEKEKS